jgi:hypothetical protein
MTSEFFDISQSVLPNQPFPEAFSKQYRYPSCDLEWSDTDPRSSRFIELIVSGDDGIIARNPSLPALRINLEVPSISSPRRHGVACSRPELRAAFSAWAPQRSDDDHVVVECVVEVKCDAPQIDAAYPRDR